MSVFTYQAVDIICTECGEAWIARTYDGESIPEDAYKCHCGGTGEIA